METTHRRPTLGEALTPLIAMGIFLGLGYAWQGYRIEVVLLASAAVAGFIARRLGYSWKEMEQGVVSSLSKAMPAMLILITVGALIASWIAAGTIPMLIWYGLQLISPKLYLVTACVICSIVSISTGTSWGTVGTVGVALIGVAQGLGIPMGAAAGAVVSGAYFGDKLSPFSDTTNLAPVVARANLFDHIRWMLWTTFPAWTLGLIVYLIVGLGSNPTAMPDIGPLQDGLQAAFRFNILLLLPLVIILWFAAKKLPTLPGILLASLVAAILALIFQGTPLKEVMEATILGYQPATGIADLDSLLARGGMMAMMDVTLIVFCAFGFAGIMSGCGILERILEALMSRVKRTFGLIAATVATGVTTAFVTGSSYLSIIVPGELFARAFSERGLAAKNLSRTTEDSGTVVVPLIPWSAAGVFMAATLGVPTLEYLPWAIMNYTGFIFALICGATGIGIAQKIRDDETLPGS
ncbi:Na+/H+ antiporter NhaC [Gemmatimonadota bacterium]